MNRTHVLIVNRNNLELTRNCVADLEKQTHSFDLTLVDNGSTEPGTQAFLNSVKGTVLVNSINTSLNQLWNEFAEKNANEFLCFLNNDVRISTHFIADSETLFDREKNVGVTCHATNNKQFTETTPLHYEILKPTVRQGWDFTIRRSLFVPIPAALQWFFGDDWIWQSVYDAGLQSAVLFSSPVIHYQGKTSRAISHQDPHIWRQVGKGKKQLQPVPWSNTKPTYSTITEQHTNA